MYIIYIYTHTQCKHIKVITSNYKFKCYSKCDCMQDHLNTTLINAKIIFIVVY